jgi:PAS domain-containing protein
MRPEGRDCVVLTTITKRHLLESRARVQPRARGLKPSGGAPRALCYRHHAAGRKALRSSRDDAVQAHGRQPVDLESAGDSCERPVPEPEALACGGFPPRSGARSLIGCFAGVPYVLQDRTDLVATDYFELAHLARLRDAAGLVCSRYEEASARYPAARTAEEQWEEYRLPGRAGASSCGPRLTMDRMGPRFGARAIDERSVGGPEPPAPRQGPPGGIDALQRMAALVEFSEDPIIGLTLDGLVTDWNPAAERLYGYSSEEMLRASVAVLVPPELHGRTGNLLGKVAAGEAIK